MQKLLTAIRHRFTSITVAPGIRRHISAATFLFIIVIVGLVADDQQKNSVETELRAHVTEHLNLIQTRLEGNVNSNVHLVRGLVSTLQTEPQMDQSRFAQLAANLFREKSQLRNIAGAPNFVISLMYPMRGNQKALGLDYRKNKEQRDAAMHVRDSGKIVLAGPVDLVQGGQGIIARFPVFASRLGRESFWGIVSAVIDVEKLFADSGLTMASLPIDVALVGKDGTGASGKQFFGNHIVMKSDPVTATVNLPSGRWVIAAIPRGGWDVRKGDIWIARLLIVAIGFALFIPLAIANRQTALRQEHYETLVRREEQLERISKRMELAIDAGKMGVWELNPATGKILWDDRLQELYDIPPNYQSIYINDWVNLLHTDDRARARWELEKAINSQDDYKSEFRIVSRSGEIRVVRAAGTRCKETSENWRFVGVNWDITEDVKLNEKLLRAKKDMESQNRALIKAKAHIEHQALHDPLTGIPNRRYLDEYIREISAFDDDSDQPFALMIVDLDRFKQINDLHGHAIGDALLVHVANLLKASVGSSDFVARIGGDEFVVVCNPTENSDKSERLAKLIVAELSKPFVFRNLECQCGVSIGISIDAPGSRNLSELLNNADLALYKAKNRGRSCFEYYSEEIRINILRSKKLADDIHRGLDQGEFIPFYQPQYHAHTHEITGLEALARWKHPELGILNPVKFMQVAEEIGVAAKIDRAILFAADTHLQAWRKQGIVVPKIAVNVSFQRLRDKDLIEGLRKRNFDPRDFSFELVESIFLDEVDDIAAHNIDELKEMGIRIELDDFGTGHTSILSLLKLSPDSLKIDRQLVIPAIDSPKSRQMVKSITEIGKSLEIEVIGEGVETMEHAHLLRDLGCDSLQGYALARPMPESQLTKHLLDRLLKIA